MPIQLPASSGSHHFDVPELKVTAGAYSVCGANRKNNEDCKYIAPNGNLFIVADGMGGHQAGEFASRFVVDALTHELERVLDDARSDQEVEKHVQAAFEHANCLLLDVAEAVPEHQGAGTTAVLALLFGDRLFVSGIGDSRAYLLREGSLERLLQDDSLPALLEQMGVISAEQAQNHPARNQLLAFLGMKDFQPNHDIRVLQIHPGDRVLLCSDGLTDVVNDDEIEAVLLSHGNAKLAARQLVQTAVEHKSKDDVTCIVFVVQQVPGLDRVEQKSGGLAAMLRSFVRLFTPRQAPATAQRDAVR